METFLSGFVIYGLKISWICQTKVILNSWAMSRVRERRKINESWNLFSSKLIATKSFIFSSTIHSSKHFFSLKWMRERRMRCRDEISEKFLRCATEKILLNPLWRLFIPLTSHSPPLGRNKFVQWKVIIYGHLVASNENLFGILFSPGPRQFQSVSQFHAVLSWKIQQSPDTWGWPLLPPLQIHTKSL